MMKAMFSNGRIKLAHLNLLFFLVLLVGVSAYLSPKFFTANNFFNLLQQSSIIGIASIGMTLVILLGGIDLSVGSLAALAGMVVGILLAGGQPIAVAIPAALVVGGLMGAISGLFTAVGKVPAFIVTLAMMEIARGLTLLTTYGKPVSSFPEAFKFLGGGFVGPVPVSGLIWIGLTIILWAVLRYTVFGRSLYSIGGNFEAAHLSGVRVTRNTVYAFILSGLTAATSGILLASWLTVSQPTAGKSMELDAIASVVLGGAALSGGRGGVWGTFLGVWLLAIITNIFNLIGISSYYQMIFKGIIIVTALLLNKFYDAKK